MRGVRSPFLPAFDPFWARTQKAGLLVALHASDSGYQQYLNTWEGTEGEYVAFRPQNFVAVADDGRSIQDALASAICHGMLTRFPGVRLMSVENGGSWVGHLVRNLDNAARRCPTSSPNTPASAPTSRTPRASMTPWPGATGAGGEGGRDMNHQELAGKVAIVTGGAGGMGGEQANRSR